MEVLKKYYFLLEYTYYRVYKWQLKAYGENNSPEFSALLAVSALLFVNGLSIYSLICIFIGTITYINLTYFMSLGVISQLICWYLYHKGTRWKKIEKYYDKNLEHKYNHKLYIMLSIILPIVFVVVSKKLAT